MGLSQEPWNTQQHQATEGTLPRNLILDANGKEIALVWDKDDARAIAALPKLLALCRKVASAGSSVSLWDASIAAEKILAEFSLVERWSAPEIES